MKVAFLSDAQSVHTKRWVSALASRDIEILLFSLGKDDGYYSQYTNVKVVSCGMNIEEGGMLSKLKYFLALPKLKKELHDFQPDLINAHHISSYGVLAALSGYHPLVLSVWGGDIYDFPNKIPFGKIIIKYVLRKADQILSTSEVMARETSKYTDKNILITPFGVDITKFKHIEGLLPQKEFVVGNVKTLEPRYGIDVLIRAFKIISDNNPDVSTRLVIYGKGAYRHQYERLAVDLGIADKTEFKGFVANELLPEVYNSVSVSVSVSVSDAESFGVVAVEAMACECPVVVSDADGFTEVVKDKETGFIVPRRNPKATAEAIQIFLDNPSLREKMGKAGRQRVQKLYNWEDNVNKMINIYREICHK